MWNKKDKLRVLNIFKNHGLRVVSHKVHQEYNDDFNYEPEDIDCTDEDYLDSAFESLTFTVVIYNPDNIDYWKDIESDFLKLDDIVCYGSENGDNRTFAFVYSDDI